MFKYAVILCALIAFVAGKPGVLHAPLLAPAVLTAPAPVVTATSSQVVARNFNGIAAAPIIAAAPVPVAPVVRAVAPVPAPLAAPLATPLISKYATAPLAAPVSAPLPAPVFARYAAAPIRYSSAPASLLF